MPDQQTNADSLWVYLSGAGSDGGAQTDPDAALGNYRSSTLAEPIGFSITSPISNITVDFVSGENGTGSGSLAATGADELKYTAPGGAQGAGVTILNGETKIIEDTTIDKYVRVTRTSATALTGTATVVCAESVGNVYGLDDWTGDEAAAGDDEYRAVIIKNMNVASITLVTAWVGTLGTQAVSDSAQLGASGAGTITTTGSFATWPASGFCHIRETDGTHREIVYYSSRTTTSLTVPAVGRALLGSSAAAGAATDTVDAVPGIRLAEEAPSAQPAGFIQTIADEDTAPTGRTWNNSCWKAGGISIGTLATTNIEGLWIHRHVPAGAVADPNVLQKVMFGFDTA